MSQIEKKTEENPVVRDIYSDLFKGKWDKLINTVAKSLSVKIARDIKSWRMDEEYSWRFIATRFVEKYPDASATLNIISGNQISGMQLCDAAMKKLKETIEQGWN